MHEIQNSVVITDFPTPEEFGHMNTGGEYSKVYVGGEREALQHYQARLAHEKKAFQRGSFLPNRRDPDILCPPKSLSPDIKFGTISVRTFYWGIMDAYVESKKNAKDSADSTLKVFI